MEDTIHKTTLTREGPWPSAVKYIKVAVVLFVLTALEVIAYEIVDEGAPAALAAAIEPVLVAILLVLSAAKFVLVGAFYMHLKQDSVFFSGLFVFPIAIAGMLVAVLIVLFSYMNNVVGSDNMINEAVVHRVDYSIFTSSIAVYGRGSSPFSENTQCVPEDPYQRIRCR